MLEAKKFADWTDENYSEFAELLDYICRDNGNVGHADGQACPLSAFMGRKDSKCSKTEARDYFGYNFAHDFINGYDNVSHNNLRCRPYVFNLGHLFGELYP